MLARRIVPSVMVLFCLAICTGGRAEEPSQEDQKGQFLRLLRDDDKSPVALQAAIVRCVPIDCGQTGPTVDLISAVHVGEKSYYDELNRRFEKYDVVLYELVAPEGSKIPKEGVGPGTSPVSLLQSGMTRMLELEFQLNGIDYTAENLVHADMSPEQFAKSMRTRGESMLQVFFRMMGYAMARQNSGLGGSGDLRLLLALFDENRALAMKRIMAEQFEDMEGSLTAVNGPDGSTLITERNKVALEVLRKQLAAGKQKLAIFYGAGHMSDFEQRLRVDFGLVPIGTEWLVAWDLKAETAETGEPEASDRPDPVAEEAEAPATAQ